MNLIIAITRLMSRHQQALQEIGINEANGDLLKVSLQLNRLRTAEEQRELLNTYYHKTLEKLKELDETGFPQLPLIIQFVSQDEANLEQLSSTMDAHFGFMGLTGKLETIDFAGIENADLNAIPKDHDVYPILVSYKDHLANEHFLERIKELMNMLEGEGHIEDKLSEDEVREVKDEKVTALTAAQKVLALYHLMRWSGIELGDRQGAKQQRFIAALSGISVGTVKEKFPSGSVVDKPSYIQNLKALIPLFESIGATKLIEKIETNIELEQEEKSRLTK